MFRKVTGGKAHKKEIKRKIAIEAEENRTNEANSDKTKSHLEATFQWFIKDNKCDDNKKTVTDEDIQCVNKYIQSIVTENKDAILELIMNLQQRPESSSKYAFVLEMYGCICYTNNKSTILIHLDQIDILYKLLKLINNNINECIGLIQRTDTKTKNTDNKNIATRYQNPASIIVNENLAECNKLLNFMKLDDKYIFLYAVKQLSINQANQDYMDIAINTCMGYTLDITIILQSIMSLVAHYDTDSVRFNDLPESVKNRILALEELNIYNPSIENLEEHQATLMSFGLIKGEIISVFDALDLLYISTDKKIKHIFTIISKITTDCNKKDILVNFLKIHKDLLSIEDLVQRENRKKQFIDEILLFIDEIIPLCI